MAFRLVQMFLFFLIGQSIHAGPVCNSIQECQNLIRQAEMKIEELSKSGNQRISNTGAVFVRDLSLPALGEAYRDPAGLIWGSAVNTHGKARSLNQLDADQYCKSIGARLPTKEDFERLTEYLGRGSAVGYSPYLAQGKAEFLPGLVSGISFWTSTIDQTPWDPQRTYNNAFHFDGRAGWLHSGFRGALASVRCVSSH